MQGTAGKGPGDPAERLCTCPSAYMADESRGRYSACASTQTDGGVFLFHRKTQPLGHRGRKCRWLNLFGARMLVSGDRKRKGERVFSVLAKEWRK